MLTVSRTDIDCDYITEFDASRRFIKLPIDNYLRLLGIYDTINRPQIAVIYELHIRDLSMDKSAPFPKSARGKFAGLTYSNLKGSKGEPVGIAAIKDLGITHLQLLPIYDFGRIVWTLYD